MAGNFFSTGVNLASGVATTAAAGAQGLAADAQTDTFLAGMQTLTQESNKVQLQMGYMNLQKTLVEGFAKFIREMGKGFTMQ
jgi:hypothetical protein